MNIINSQRQHYYQIKLLSNLIIGGAIASSGGYAFAQQLSLPLPTCIPSPTNPCTISIPTNFPVKDPPHPQAHIPPKELRIILQLYPQAIRKLQQDDPDAVQKIRYADSATLQKLQQLAPGSQTYLQPLIQRPQLLNQPIPKQLR